VDNENNTVSNQLAA